MVKTALPPLPTSSKKAKICKRTTHQNYGNAQQCWDDIKANNHFKATEALRLRGLHKSLLSLSWPWVTPAHALFCFRHNPNKLSHLIHISWHLPSLFPWSKPQSMPWALGNGEPGWTINVCCAVRCEPTEAWAYVRFISTSPAHNSISCMQRLSSVQWTLAEWVSWWEGK